MAAGGQGIQRDFCRNRRTQSRRRRSRNGLGTERQRKAAGEEPERDVMLRLICGVREYVREASRIRGSPDWTSTGAGTEGGGSSAEGDGGRDRSDGSGDDRGVEPPEGVGSSDWSRGERTRAAGQGSMTAEPSNRKAKRGERGAGWHGFVEKGRSWRAGEDFRGEKNNPHGQKVFPHGPEMFPHGN